MLLQLCPIAAPRRLEVQIGWRIYMIDGVIMNTGAEALAAPTDIYSRGTDFPDEASEVWQKLQDAMWQWRFFAVSPK